MLIAQITDLHLGFDPDDPDEFNRQRLDRTLAALCVLHPTPDLVLVTGDIADNGEDGISYERYAEAIGVLPFPAWPMMGNHDSRAPFLARFPETRTADGFIQYEIDAGPIRILMLDTLQEGRHGGAYCEDRAGWLADRLDSAPERPTLIALHHPPIDTGIDWLTERPDAAWIGRLHDVLVGRPNILGIIAGHVHRPITTMFAGHSLFVCPSTAPQVALDLTPIDPDAPDGRPMIIADHPYFALHWWNGRNLISHLVTAEEDEVLASFTPDLQPLVRMLAEEKKT
jgi:3',5'-cyclic-AMP phosphodiesterase